MAGRANSLTTGAIQSGQDNWTAPASELRVFLNALAELGHDIGALINAAGLGGTNLEDPEARVPCEAYAAIFGGAQQRRFTPNLPLELARRTPLGAYPLLDYLVLTSDTAGAGLEQLARYFRITTNPLVLDVRDDRDPVEIRVTAPNPFGVEYLASLIALHLRQETDGRFVLKQVMLRKEPDDAAAMSRALGCPIETGAPWDGVCISQESWNLPLRRRDPVLRRVLESHADEMLARLPTRTGVALEVQRVLSRSVALRDARIDTIARRLGMSARSLQRRLSAEGVGFQTLLDDARKEAAARYVAESGLALAEVAYLVGYSEPAPFHRAFKRWYGATPDQFRKRGVTATSGTPPDRASVRP